MWREERTWHADRVRALWRKSEGIIRQQRRKISRVKSSLAMGIL